MNAEELGKLYPIFLVDYDEGWPALFLGEKERLTGMLERYILRIEHIGSTAIPGMRAKPTIDILVEHSAGASAEDIHGRMTGRGYIRMAEQEDHMMFVRGYSPTGLERESFHVHMYPEGDVRIADSILFRDWLRTHPDAAEEYAALKDGLASRFRNDREAYTEGKGEFIAGILARSSP